MKFKFDRRRKYVKKYYQIERWYYANRPLILASALLGVMAAMVLVGTLKKEATRPLLDPRASKEFINAHKVVNLIKPKTALAVEEKKADVVQTIQAYFPEQPQVAVAVFKHESGLNPRAQGWNCRYQVNGKWVSKACKKEDRGKAWSTDCGIAQISVKGTTCPAHLLTVEGGLKKAREMYERRGFQPWVSFVTNRYQKYL
jgi:hypothetical protein